MDEYTQINKQPAPWKEVIPTHFHTPAKPQTSMSRAEALAYSSSEDNPSSSDESLDYFENYEMPSDDELDYVSVNDTTHDTTLDSDEPLAQYAIRSWMMDPWLQVYRSFVTDELLDHIVEETNRYVELICIYLSTVLLYSGGKGNQGTYMN